MKLLNIFSNEAYMLLHDYVRGLRAVLLFMNFSLCHEFLDIRMIT